MAQSNLDKLLKAHPSLKKSLDSGNGRVFAHTNRNLWKTKQKSVYSIHPLMNKTCGKGVVYKDLYPHILVLEDVELYFGQKDRDNIMREVRSRIQDCRDFKGVRRTVYGGVCGDLVSMNSLSDAQRLLNDPELEWVSGGFPSTFPRDDLYEKYRDSDCQDPKIIDWQQWEKFNRIDSWFIIDNLEPIAIQSEDVEAAILLGSDQATPQPRWSVKFLLK